MTTRPALAQGQASGCGSPVLDVYTTVAGQRTDAAVVEFIIWERVTTPLVPVRVFPVAGREPVDVATFCDDGGGRLGLGHYVASWDVEPDALIGAYAIEWFFQLTVDSAEFTLVEDFDVVALVGSSDASLYCTVQDIRDEGVPVSQASDARVLRAITVASRMIDGFTGRWFYPKDMVITLDGRGHATLRIGAPIISISAVVIDYWNTEPDEGYDVATESLEVYNRHITQGLTAPDDREDPQIVLRWTDDHTKRLGLGAGGMLSFPKGTQNVRVTGTFGYTDPDGTATGCTPILIGEACRRMTIRQLPRKATLIAGAGGPIKREKTREQEQEFGDPAKLAIQGAFTGDPEIDMILARYRRPMALGAA